MRNLEGVAESLRPLVESKQWDYCVVWKLGDDPSRFIEMMGCCCGGGYEYDCVNVKEEEGESHSAKLCRDGFLKHPIRTKACEALSQLPSSMPLYSGIHSEVIISAQPRWLSGHVNASGSNPSQSHDYVGTRVLIPVLSDLIELFSTKNIPENQKMLELFMAPFNNSLKQEPMATHDYAIVNLNASASLNEFHVDPLPEESPEKLLPSLNLANFIPGPQVFPSSVSQTTSCPILEGSSSGSNPSSEHPLLSSRSRKSRRGDNLLQQQTGLASGSGSVVEKHKAKVTRKTGSGQYQSKNLFAERNRRSRIKDGHFALRALVPKISKMDIPAIIGDAVEYIEELKKKVKELEDELREIEEEEDLTKNKADVKILASDMRKEGSICLISTEHKQGSSSFVQKSPTAVQVEVNQIGKRDCLIKLFYEQSRGGFANLMENMDSLGLQVVDANVTTFDGNVLNILKVQANRDIQAKKLRDKLIQLTRETNQTVHKGIN
ncbi:PREDICTED: transcription factor bHLH90 [Prunus mume]|uniref:Transcription factor bHLH90 n=1 Tax=Prunus mume TaxID=102107 RepID=A0ABM0NAI6_PRUMU|nr:PREDICTED: transcription factor bHLH90 [Prunus mume]